MDRKTLRSSYACRFEGKNRLGRRWLTSGVLALSAAVVVSACGSSGGGTSSVSKSPASSGGTYKVGYVTALSGPGAGFFSDGSTGAKAAFASDGGSNFKLTVADDATDPPTAAQVCSRLATQDHVVAIIGAEITPAALACYQDAKEAGIPYLAAVNGSVLGCESGLFVVGLSPQQATEPLVKYLVGHGKKRIYFVGSQSAAPETQAALAGKDLAALGGSVVGKTFVPVGTSDYSSVIQHIEAAKPDAIIGGFLSTADGLAFHKQAASSSLADVTQADTQMQPSEAKQLGGPANGILTIGAYFPSISTATSKTFLASFKQSGGSADPTPGAETAYNAGNMLIAAVKKLKAQGQSVTGANLIKTLPSIVLKGPSGSLRLDGHYAGLTSYVAAFSSDGVAKVVGSSGTLSNPQVAGCSA